MDPLAARRTLPTPQIGTSSTTPSYHGRGGPHGGGPRTMEQQQPTGSTHFIAQVFFHFVAPTDDAPPAIARPRSTNGPGSRPGSAATLGFDSDDGDDDRAPSPSREILPGVIVRAPATTSVRQFVDLALTKMCDEVGRIADASLPGNPVADVPPGYGVPGFVVQPSNAAEATGARAAAIASLNPPSVALEDFSLHLARPDGTGILAAPEGGSASHHPRHRPMSGTLRPRLTRSGGGGQTPAIPPSPFDQPSQILLQSPAVSFPYAFVVASAGVDYSAVTAAAGRGARASLTDDRLEPAVALVQPGRTRLPHLVTLKQSAVARLRRIAAVAEANADNARAMRAQEAAAATATAKQEQEQTATAPPSANGSPNGLGGIDGPATRKSAGTGGSQRRAGTSGSSRAAALALRRASTVGSAAARSLSDSTVITSGRGTAAGTAVPRVSRDTLPHLFVADDDDIMSRLGLSAYDLASFAEGPAAAEGVRVCVATGPTLEQVEIDRRRSEAVAVRERRAREADTGRARDCIDAAARIAQEQRAAKEDAAVREARTTLEAAREKAAFDISAAQRSHNKSRQEAALRDEVHRSQASRDDGGEVASTFGPSTSLTGTVFVAPKRAVEISSAVDASILAKERQRDATLHPSVTYAGPLLGALHAGSAARALQDEAALRQRTALTALQTSLEAACVAERHEADDQALRDAEQRHLRANAQNHTDAVKVAEGRRAGAKRDARNDRRTEAERLRQLQAAHVWTPLAESRKR